MPPDVLRRLSAVAKRHPESALLRLAALERQARAANQLAAAADALYARFYLLEHRGRALELQAALTQAERALTPDQAPLQVARLCEALGRLAYQQGEYNEATSQWRRAAHLAEQQGEAKLGAAARIGLGQIHYAFGDWERGREIHGEAASLLGTADDSYLAAKLALNIGVGHFETHELDDAERHFSHGLAAARRGQHREYEAEAHWQLARAALARGRLDWATTDCRMALSIASKLGHSWLEAAASRSWTDIALARGDQLGAIRSTEHALLLAERIHSRPQQSQAHLQLAKLKEARGQKEAALRHLWQHQALQAEIERLSGAAHLPTQSATQKRADEMLLALSNQRWHLQEPSDLLRALQHLCAASARILPLSQLLFWWAEAPSEAAAAATLADEALPHLDPVALQPYLDWLAGQALPHAQTSRSTAHPHALLIDTPDHLPGAPQHPARLELPLMVGSRVVALLWLLPSQEGHDWSSRELLHASHLARLFEALLSRR
ncbi:MAG: tetratricopeptide repeat protein [Roseateles sp.]